MVQRLAFRLKDPILEIMLLAPPALPPCPPAVYALRVDRGCLPCPRLEIPRPPAIPSPPARIDTAFLHKRDGPSPTTAFLLQAGLEILVTSLGGSVSYPRPLHPPIGP